MDANRQSKTYLACLSLLAAIIWVQGSKPARALTCADSDPSTPNVPFDCDAYNMVFKPAAADLPVKEGDFTSFLTCCDAATTIGAPPNLYLSFNNQHNKSSSEQLASSKQLRISGTVGQTVEVTLVVGLQGLQDTRIDGIRLSGSLLGMQVISIQEADGSAQACEMVSTCATKSEIFCNWASLNWDSGATTATRTLTLTIRLTDAAITRSSSLTVTADSYLSGKGATVYQNDMNDDDNVIQLKPRIKAACCSSTGTCMNTFKKDCPKNRSFSPYSPCNSKPCLPPSVTRGNNKKAKSSGVCLLSGTCLERVQGAAACRAGKGKYYASSRLCREVLVQSGC